MIHGRFPENSLPLYSLTFVTHNVHILQLIACDFHINQCGEALKLTLYVLQLKLNYLQVNPIMSGVICPGVTHTLYCSLCQCYNGC